MITRPGRTLSLSADARSARATISAAVRSTREPLRHYLVTVEHLFASSLPEAATPVYADFEHDEGSISHEPCGRYPDPEGAPSSSHGVALVACSRERLAPQPVDGALVPKLWPSWDLNYLTGKRCGYRGSQSNRWTWLEITREAGQASFVGRPPDYVFYGDSGSPLYYFEANAACWLVGILEEFSSGFVRFHHPGPAFDELEVQLLEATS